MIVTRTYLEEYINLDGISNEEIVQKLNNIGLEVDGAKEYKIPSKVVVGEIISCKKHPNADKLNLCEVNIGNEIVQIICGAANVVDAKYVAVATIGAILPGNFKIKKAKLRGVESFGMICSSSELGLPTINDGIMILDNSIGELIVGKELNEYKKLADFVIEVDITANRGDALSIFGIARDLSVAFKRELKEKEFLSLEAKESNISLELKDCDSFEGRVEYKLIEIENINIKLLEQLRAAFCELEFSNNLELLLSLAINERNVLLRTYDASKIAENNKIIISLKNINNKIEVLANEKRVSILGINANSEFIAKDKGVILLEASYIDSKFIVEAVNRHKLKTDKLYYNSSRGSEVNIEAGLKIVCNLLKKDSKAFNLNHNLKIDNKINKSKIITSIKEINDIIGNELNKDDILDILIRLGYEIKEEGDSLLLNVPLHFHEVKNSQDIAEEIVRFYGINNIKAKPLTLIEKNRITKTYLKFREKEALINRAIASSFNEAITYAFTNKDELLKYDFEVIDDKLELINPIVKELNSLRSTLLINLLQAISKNIKYGKKSIALFEIGTIFDKNRNEYEKIAFVFSGEDERASVKTKAKAKNIDFISFVDKISSIIGEFKLRKVEPKNALMHPYQSAEIIKNKKIVGFISKLHPKVVKDYEIYDTFIAEFDLDLILPTHKNAKELSNYQPTTKDLSIVVNDDLNFYEIAKELNSFKEKEFLLKDFYPLDIYKDNTLKDKKSLTIRFILQSNSKTLEIEEIESVMKNILNLLENRFNAQLR